MVTIDGIGFLNLVKDEVDSTLQQAEAAIEAYLESPDNDAKLILAVDLFRQVRGIFRLIGLSGATMLISEMEMLGTHLAESPSDDNDKELATLSDAIIVLNHYLEYVHIKQSLMPTLLIPTINELRVLAKKPFVPESSFFPVDLNVVRDYEVRTQTDIEPDDIPKLSRRLRLMYQVGMLGVFKGENPKVNLRLMHRALKRIDKLCGDVPLGKLWWVGIGAVAALGTETIELNNIRKSVLGKIDRQIKLLVSQGATVLEQEPPAQLLKECLYLVSLADTDESSVVQLKDAFALDTVSVTDNYLRQERELMNGPGGNVIQTVATALKDELSHIKDSLDLGARGVKSNDEAYANVKDTLMRTANTLVMLGLIDPSNVLKDLADRVQGWLDSGEAVDSEEYNAIADSLLFVENAIIELRNENMPQQTMSDLDDIPGEEGALSLSQLEEARQVVVGESRAGLSIAKRAISSYVDSHWDGMHLNNVPVSLHSVWGGLVFLQLERAAKVMQSCSVYIEKQLIDTESGKPDEHLMETLADALTSIDYYLESMEENKPIGDGVLDVAEESVHELGYPITELA